MNKILVTGATGFIGKALVNRLREQGVEVFTTSSSSGDAADTAVYEAVKGQGVKHVFHLAGRTYVPDSWSDPMSFYRVNVLGTVNVLEYCRSEQAPLVYVSAYLYGNPDHLPISESDAVHPNNPYAHTKHVAEEICSFYADIHGLAVTVLRPFNIYGPGQDERFLIPAIIKQAISAEVIQVQDLAPRRDFLHLEDMLEALMCAANGCEGYRVYNIGSGISYSVQEVIDIVQAATGLSKPVVSAGKTRRNEIYDVVADISRAASDLGWSPKIRFQDGIRDMVRSFGNE